MSEPLPPPDDPYRAPEAPLENPVEGSGPVSDEALRLLVATRWGMKVVAIALMSNGVLSLIGGFIALSYLPGQVPKGVIILFVALIALAMFLPGLRLMQSALAVTRAQRGRRERDVTRALDRHQQFWMFFGIMLIFVAALFYFLFGMVQKLR